MNRSHIRQKAESKGKGMNYKSFNLEDWIGHISGAIEDERERDGNEMRDLVEFLTTLNKEPILDKIRAEIIEEKDFAYADFDRYKEEVLCVEPDELPDDDYRYGMERCIEILDKYKAEMENK